MNEAYKQSGVDVEAGYKSVELIRKHVRGTFRPEVLSDIGGFGGLFSLAKIKDMEEPVSVSGTDGVGTKLRIAFLTDKHDTVGIDCVAMCVNDIVCSGAEPLFFLDYIACGKNVPERIEQIVKGVTDGCLQANCSLIGGETAEMPGFYPVSEYDMAGFAVGVADKKKLVDGKRIAAGDVLIGLASNGVHSNGFSLIRKVLRPSEASLAEFVESLGTTLGEELLKPTRIYVKPLLSLLKDFDIKGMSHITGGGFIENIPRMLPDGLKPVVKRGAWPIPPIFALLQGAGEIADKDMFNTFNMGIGIVMAVSAQDAEAVCAAANALGEKAYIIGEVADGEGVDIC